MLVLQQIARVGLSLIAGGVLQDGAHCLLGVSGGVGAHRRVKLEVFPE